MSTRPGTLGAGEALVSLNLKPGNYEVWLGGQGVYLDERE